LGFFPAGAFSAFSVAGSSSAGFFAAGFFSALGAIDSLGVLWLGLGFRSVVAGGGEGREVADLLWGEEEAEATTL
jgi:hypothetical protein